MDWTAIGAIATAVSALIILPVSVFAARQLREMKRSGQLNAFVSVVEFLQEDRVRDARGHLISLKNKPDISGWSGDDIKAADLACRAYNSVAIMIEKGLIEKEFVLPEWQNSIMLCWEAAQPLVKKYRGERNKKYWDSLQKLYELAKRIG